jgi:hypothetical protein
MPDPTPTPTPEDLLFKYRPVRYSHGDMAYMQSAIDADEKLIAADKQQVKKLARQLAEYHVKRLEEKHTRMAHKFMRNLGRTGQAPLSIEMIGLSGCPLKVVKEKFRLEVATASDLERWELQRRRDHDGSSQRMLWEVRGVGHVMQWMKGQGAATFGNIDWKRVPVLRPDAEVEPDLPEDGDDDGDEV